MSTPLYKPGTDNLSPGSYKEVGPRGGSVPKPRQVHIDQGYPFSAETNTSTKWQIDL